MSRAQAIQDVFRDSDGLFPYEKWEARLPALARQYRENHPCPHILLEGFLNPEAAIDMA
ncbi:MAG: hypothetical protein WAL05_11475 [Candidatus Sulfotelmatobacter sp.]